MQADSERGCHGKYGTESAALHPVKTQPPLAAFIQHNRTPPPQKNGIQSICMFLFYFLLDPATGQGGVDIGTFKLQVLLRCYTHKRKKKR